MEGTSSTRPTRLTGEQRRSQVLDAAKAVVDREGFHGASIEAVAREAGISRPIVYEHFGDRAGLLDALIEREADRARDQLAEFLPSDLSAGSPADLLLAAFAGYLRAAQTDPMTWRLVLVPPAGAPQALRDGIAEGRDAVIAQLAEAIRAAPLAETPPPDAELVARMLSTLADEAIRLLLEDPDRYPADRALETARWFLRHLPS